MEHLISIILGTPTHGWLPVDFCHNDFQLGFDASDVLNNPIEELYSAVTNLQNNQSRQVTWWLEPGAYFFNFEKNRTDVTLHIAETMNLHNANAGTTRILTVTGEEEQIIGPFRKALRQFCSQKYKEDDWPYELPKHLIVNLGGK